MGALGIDGPRLIWQIINFLILLFFLQRLLFKPIFRLMDSRADKIRQSVDEADRMRQFAEQTRQANQVALDEARKHAQKVMDDASRMADQFRQSQMEDARREAELFKQRARDEIRQERDQAVADVRRQAVDLAILAAGKVIEQSLSAPEHYRLVSDFLQKAEIDGAGAR